MLLRSRFLRDTAFVTLLNLGLRLLGLWTQSRLSGLMGAEGMGLVQLAMSVETLAAALATSGIRYSVTRLLAEELGFGRETSLGPLLRAGLRYALTCSLMAGALLLSFSEELAALAGDGRIAISLKVFALGLPFLSLNAVLGGYFLARRQPLRACASQGAEQFTMLILLVLLLPRIPRADLELRCGALAASALGADIVSLLLSYLLYRGGRPMAVRQIPADRRLVRKRVLALSLTLALSTHARTILSTLQHLLVPRLLRRSGETASAALSIYGTVSGMVFPVLGFASVFFSALSEMLIPELTEAQMRGDQGRLERIGGRVLSACLGFSALIALLLWLTAPLLGDWLYDSRDAGRYLRALSPLVLLLYMDSVTDGMLKGLGLQLSSMIINLADAALTLLASCLLLPRYGAAAYVAILYLSEAFNFLLSFLRLRRSLRIQLL